MSYTHYIPEDPLLKHEFEETWCSMSEPLLSQSMVPPRKKKYYDQKYCAIQHFFLAENKYEERKEEWYPNRIVTHPEIIVANITDFGSFNKAGKLSLKVE